MTTEQRLEAIERNLADINVFIKDGIIEPNNVKDTNKMMAEILTRILKLEEKVYDLPPRKYNPAHELNPETTKKLRDLFNKMLHTPKTTGPGVDLVHENGPEVIQTPNGRVMAATWHKIDDEGLAALSNMADMSMQDAITREGGPLPEFTTQRDWEVLEFRSTVDKSQWTLIDGRYIGSVSQFRHTIDEMLSGFRSVEDGKIRIHSVRRTTDGQVFTVGDKERRGVINRFFIRDGAMFAAGDDWDTLLRTLVKADPIFTSADGAPIYQSDPVFRWVKGGTRIIEDRACAGDDPDVHYSTRIAAETAYKNWLGEQRLLSLHDVLECLGDVEKLEEIVKTRL